MKRIIVPVLLLCLTAAVSCQHEEIVENPTFSITDASDDPVLVYGQSLEYTMDLTYFEYSKSANTNNEVLKAEIFKVKSNCSWKIVPAGDTPGWVRPFPEEGDKEGVFIFILERNNDQTSDRSAIYNVVINDGANDIKVGGDIVIVQGAAADFMKTSASKIEVNKEGGSASVTITSNLPWTYTLSPEEDYASPAIEEWITDNSKITEGAVSNKLTFRLADNSNGSIRGANLVIEPKGSSDLKKITIPITQYGLDIEVSGFPVKWNGAAGNSAYPSWASASNPLPTINATTGTGTITWHFAQIDGLDRSASSTDCSGSNPRINGLWPGDYMEFNVPAAVSAGSLIKLQFEGRISGAGIKHWMLEYNDGGVWKPAGETKTADLEADDVWPASTITYTHDMSPGGSADEYNKVISQVVRYENTTAEVAFRFSPVSNVIASSGARMAKPTTASARLDYSGATTGCEPEISCVASGGEISYADIEVKGVDKGYILFDGTPAAPVSFKVTASDDFTVSTDAAWLSVSKGATGVADEETEVEITCEASTLSEPREATLTTRKTISVIQSAAGQELNPFISVTTGNKVSVGEDAGKITVRVQTNVDVSVEADSWLTVTPINTKAMVEWTEYAIEFEANDIESPRIGVVRFFNDENNVESLINITQAGKPSELIYFKDDFEWLAQWSTSAPDDVTDNKVGSSPNIFGAAQADVLAEFISRGYGYVWGWKGQDWSDGTPDNGNKQTLYMMKNYLKFGKTSYNSGIILPALSKIEGSADIDLNFDWCWCMTGASKPDVMTLTVTVSGGGTIASTGTTVSENITSAQPTENDLTKLEWQHAKVKILGATPSTRITIRPTNNDPSVTSTRSQNRWYLDNIEVFE